MVQYFARDILRDLVVFQVIVLVVVVTNAYVLHRTKRYPAPPTYPSVSVLVPARDEEDNIESCTLSLLAQDYPSLELLVLDDGSVDSTLSVLERLARGNGRLRIVRGLPLPLGWLGKNWACAQLAALAHGDLLLFTDADTVHAPNSVRSVVSSLITERADLVTGFPRQITRTWGERLIVPFFGWALYCFLPLPLAYLLRLPALTGAVGQVMLFRREAYDAIGGHEAVRDSIAEDLSLARRARRLGHRWRIVDATANVSCRMYRSSRQAYAGLSKNLFAAFGFRLLPYLFVWAWLLLVFVLPPIDLALHLLGVVTNVPVALVFTSIALSLLLWLIPYWRLRLPPYLALAYPLSLLVVESVAMKSLCLTLTGKLVWKGRPLVPPRWRLV